MVNFIDNMNSSFEKKYGSILNPVKHKRLTESVGSDVERFQEKVDFFMKSKGYIPDDFKKKLEAAGLSLTKDQYGQYEVIAYDPDRDAKKESLKSACRRGGAKLTEDRDDISVNGYVKRAGFGKYEVRIYVDPETDIAQLRVLKIGDGILTTQDEVQNLIDVLNDATGYLSIYG